MLPFYEAIVPRRRLTLLPLWEEAVIIFMRGGKNMPGSGGQHLSVSKALYQLDFYLQTLNMQLTITDIYALAYKKKRGDHYDDRWLATLSENPDVSDSIQEPFTTHTIVETLMRTGHEPIVRALLREVRRRKITFTQAYMLGMPRRH